ncbi:hypothetical protein AYO21_11700 [Fonsecaea monophora]|uniref:Major facilitator superfamily (MFS) profile domain-containing protein n=1 Tax=Fonsecaea monophora TaxID=254056 RepID=A0A177EQF0_9EURO|nr:hypothetical protein AYO21_11700 [Fonsecaea monophora]KAH0829685.1 siderophore iron transporter [Fonsecaea pedrosoi]OAG34168.1 hypothetical protein AYO21_11700 [Fonsecaea monophora]
MSTVEGHHQEKTTEGTLVHVSDSTGHASPLPEQGEDDGSAQNTTYEKLPLSYYLTPQFLGTFLARSHILSGVFAFGITCNAGYFGWTLASNSLTAINEELGPSDSYLWISLSYTLTAAVACLLFGRLSDIFGRRWFTIGGNIVALVGGIVAATAQSIGAMIVSNVLLGFSQPVQLSYATVLPELVPFKYRGLTNAYALAVTIPGAAFGPVIAKALISHTHATWRWSYYIHIIVTSVGLLLIVAFYFPPKFSMLQGNRKRWNVVKTLDVGGMLLFIGGMVVFLIGLSWGGGTYPWRSAHVIATIVCGFLTLVALVVYEAYVPKHPLIPLSLLRNRQFLLFLVAGCSGGMIYYSMGIMWPLIVSELFTTDLVRQGWLAMSSTGGNTLGNVLCGLFYVMFRRIKWQLLIATIGMTAFIGAMASTTQYSQTKSIVISIIGTIFAGFVEGIPTISVPYTTNAEDIGLAVGVFQSIRVCAGSIAIDVYTSILSSRTASLEAKNIPKAALGAGLPASSLQSLLQALAAGSPAALATVPGMNPAIEAAVAAAQKSSFSGAVKIVFLVTIAFGSLGILATLFLQEIDHLFTDQVARKLYNPIKKKTEDAAAEAMEKAVVIQEENRVG